MKYSADGIEQGTKGTHVSHAQTHSFIGPNSIAPDFPKEEAKFAHKFQLTDLLGKAMAGEPYTIYTTDDQEIRGKTDASGMTEEIGTVQSEGTYIIFDRDLRWEVEEEHDEDGGIHEC